MSGTVFYVLGCFIAVTFFPKPIALLSISYLACGDPVAR
jgi:dolichol kinase